MSTVPTMQKTVDAIYKLITQEARKEIERTMDKYALTPEEICTIAHEIREDEEGGK